MLPMGRTCTMKRMTPRKRAMTPEEFKTIISEAGLNQTTAAAKLGVDRRTVIRWLRPAGSADSTTISERNALFIRSKIKPPKK